MTPEERQRMLIEQFIRNCQGMSRRDIEVIAKNVFVSISENIIEECVENSKGEKSDNEVEKNL